MHTQTSPPAPRRPQSARAGALAALLLAGLSGSCAGVTFIRDTETSGRFRSWGFSGTLFSWDLPKGAMNIARENASDARQPNLQVTREVVFPYFGPVDWLLDIIGLRYARVEGTWGYEAEDYALVEGELGGS